MRQNEDFFGGRELPLVYIAKRLKDAKRLEEILTTAGLDYLVETDTYRGGFLFVSERVGAFFYVDEADASAARRLLLESNYAPYEAAPTAASDSRPES